MERRKLRRLLSREERDLWAHVTRRDEPLAQRRTAVVQSPTAPEESQAIHREALPPETRQPVQSINPPKAKPASPPAPAPFDHRISKRIARGRREIDARLDLHGLRQQDAYTELRRFLAHCQAQGHRHVLIITGKGGGAAGEHADRDFWNGEQRGVLRRLVPHWLSEPALRLHVVSFTESAARHGGGGALYVTIRKGPRPRT